MWALLNNLMSHIVEIYALSLVQEEVRNKPANILINVNNKTYKRTSCQLQPEWESRRERPRTNHE